MLNTEDSSKNFFFINCEDDNYNIIFHAATSRIAKVPKSFSIEKYSESELNDNFSYLSSTIPGDKVLKKGEGRIGLTFMSARQCNLKCKYCFAGDGNYGNYECKGTEFTYQSYMKAIEQALKMYPDGVKSISFFGGEPLLDFDEIKKFVPDCLKYFKEKGIATPQLSISTNLIALHEDHAKFFKEYGLHCVISLDGPKEINDIARVSSDRNFSVYDHVLQGCELLDKYNIPFAMQATINRNHLENYKSGDAVKWIKELEAVNWINLAIVPVETDIPELKIDGDNLNKLYEFSKEVTNYYINKLFQEDMGRIASGIIAPIVQLINNKHLRSCSSGHSVFIDTDENVYPCQMFCNFDEYCIGDLEHEWSADKIYKTSNMSRNDSVACRTCISKNVCTVWCKGLQLVSNDDVYEVCEPRCVFQKANVEECIKTIAHLDKKSDKYRVFADNYRRVGVQLRDYGFITK